MNLMHFAHLVAKHSPKSSNSSISCVAWHSLYPRQPLRPRISSVTFHIAGISRKTMRSLKAWHTRKALRTCGKQQGVRN